MSLSSFEYIISKIKEYKKDCSITITGGEPLLNKNWDSIVCQSLEEFRKVCICSNGIISNENIEKVKKCLRAGAFLQLSLDGDLRTDALIRGDKHFDSTIHVINELSDYSDKLIISTSVDRQNIGSIANLIEKLNVLKFLFWKVSWIQSSHPQDDEQMLTSQEWNQFVNSVLPLCYFSVKIPKLFDFDLFDIQLSQINERHQTYSNCGFGTQKIYIFPNGDVFPCSCYSSWRMGNILTDSFGKILDNIKLLTNFEIPIDSICYSCKYKCICNSGCPGYSMKVFGKIGYGDIRCPLVNKCYDKEH